MPKKLFWMLVFFSTFAPSIKNEAKTAPPILTLQEAIQKTLEQNPELKAMQKDAEAAHEKISQARSWEDPEVGVRFYQVPLGQGIKQAQDIDYLISQNIPFPGKKKLASKIAYHEYLHHLELLDSRGREMLTRLKIDYFSLFATQQMLRISLKAEAVLKGIAEALQSKLATNQIQGGEIVQAQVEITKLISERQILIERTKVLESRLHQWMYLEEKDEIRLPPKLEIPKWKMGLNDLVEIAKIRHPSIKISDHLIEEKKTEIQAAKREYFPDFKTQMEYIQRPGPSPNAWTGEFMLNVPLIVKKKMKAVSQAQAELASAKYAHLSTENEVTSQVKQQFYQMQSAENILRINQGILIPQIRQGLEMNASAYSVGKTDFRSYLNSVLNLLNAQMEYWKSYETLSSSVFNLEEAVGATREELQKDTNE